MNLALIIIIVVAIILAIVGGLNAAFQWLLWVALIVGVIALIAFLFRVIGGRNRV
jgi:Flp pilus assembly protein protease CpaA